MYGVSIIQKCTYIGIRRTDFEDKRFVFCRNDSDQFGKSTSDNESESEKSRAVPTKPVLGIKSDEVERPKPLFYMKPVNQDGLGIRGPEGDRLEDLGKIGCDKTIGM